MDGCSCAFFTSSSSFINAKLKRIGRTKLYNIVSNSHPTIKNVNAHSQISNQTLVVFRKPEKIWAIDPEFYINMWYNNLLRAPYIVDSKQHKDANDYSQFINSPSVQPDTMNAYLQSCLSIVKQKYDSLTVVKPGDIRKCNKYWILITNIYHIHTDVPKYTIEYQKIFTLQQLLNIFKTNLSVDDDATNEQLIHAAIHTKSNIFNDRCNFWTKLQQLQDPNPNLLSTYYAVSKKHFVNTSDQFELSKFSSKTIFQIVCIYLCMCMLHLKSLNYKIQ